MRVGLAWHDITNQTVNAANFAEPVTQSRTWAVSWLAAARALRRNHEGDYAVAAFTQALDYLQDPTWTSFWAAPQHPEYPSGHGGQIGSQQGVLDAFLGPHAPVP